MAQCGKFSSHRPAIYGIPEELLDEFADVFLACRQKISFSLLQKLCELLDVAGIGRKRKRGQSLFDSQVVKETVYGSGNLFWRTLNWYARYRTLGKVITGMPGEKLYHPVVKSFSAARSPHF